MQDKPLFTCILPGNVNGVDAEHDTARTSPGGRKTFFFFSYVRVGEGGGGGGKGGGS